MQALEGERAKYDEDLRTQDETQRQINECLAFKLSKQSEEELGRQIDQVTAQISDVRKLKWLQIHCRLAYALLHLFVYIKCQSFEHATKEAGIIAMFGLAV